MIKVFHEDHLHYAVYLICHQSSDILSQLDNDWNHFSYVCWNISISTIQICQSVLPVPTWNPEICPLWEFPLVGHHVL